MLRTLSFALLGWSLLISGTGAEDSAQQESFFETRIRPVLVKHCYECHSAKSKEPKGGLLLDTREGIRRGGDSGHGVVPGQLADSQVIAALRGESYEMPPKGPLPDNVIADFEKWIRSGAHDPRDGKSAMIRREIDFERAREFWSFQPLEPIEPPVTANVGWVQNDIDRFILSRLESKGLSPVGDAASAVMARRIYFDLIGLPPTLEQLDAFVAAADTNLNDAIATLVDRLLESPQFGERWGRHWLDVVRFAESTGMERNGTYTRAWKYRNYVIDALNQDTPFDQFVHQQIAGDLMPHESQSQRDRNLIATGMLAIGPKSLNETKKEKFQMDVVDEQIDVVTRAFVGLTASCARCHDHKFDPIPQREYYSLAGIFTSTDTLYGTGRAGGNRNAGRLLAIAGDSVKPVATAGGTGAAQEEKKYRNQLKGFKRRIATAEKQLAAAKNEKSRKAIQQRITQTQELIRKTGARLKRLTESKPDSTQSANLVMAVLDSSRIGDTKLRIRGEPDEHGGEIPRGFLTIASLQPGPELPQDSSGRRELAQWITRPSNPLTSRVIANRIWQHLFGRGIVRTVNNFGANGERPTHPELLDYLAARMVDQDWSIKSMIREITSSHAYRMASADDSAGLQKDPDNQMLWRMPQRRLEAEAIRDAMLSASGQLDLDRPSASAVEKLGEGIIGRTLRADTTQGTAKNRSVYLPILRGVVPEALAVFDFPEPSIVGGVRNVTTVSTQALYMMNSATVIEQARGLAQRVISNQSDSAQRVRMAYKLTLTRQPSDQEVEAAIAYIEDSARALTSPNAKKDKQDSLLAWTAFCQTLFASSEFRYLN